MELFSQVCTGIQRLDLFLRDFLSNKVDGELSNSKVRRLVISGSVSVGGMPCTRPAYQLRKGQKVEVRFEREKFFFEKQPEDVDFVLTLDNVLFEDEDLIIVNKPPFIPVEKTFVEDRKNLQQCVIDYLWKKNPSLRNPPYCGVMHRLDRETSGAILFTKSRKFNREIFALIEGHHMNKTYFAVVENRPSLKDKFSVEGQIDRISPKSQKCKMGMVHGNRGLYSRTEFSVEKRMGQFALVKCVLETGRTHQIRVHLSRVGFPIVGDDLYGGPPGLDKCGDRIMLHAVSLEFAHPGTGKILKAVAPVPDSWSEV